MNTIVFVCTGNTCRSPMAEGIFNAMAGKHHLDVRAISAGTSAFGGAPAADDAVIATNRYGADISGHVSKMVTGQMISDARSVYCMTREHARMLERTFPEYANKIHLLSPGGIPDPFMRGPAAYELAAEQIHLAITGLIKSYKQSRESADG